MISTLSVPLLVVLSLLDSSAVFAAPQTGASNTAGQVMSLTRRRPGPPSGTAEDWGLWAKNQREILQSKYGVPTVARRASGENL
jgi:cathepsin D